MADKVYVTNGASNHSNKERALNDYYATNPKAVEMLLELETFNKNILEPCCGEGHISKVLEQNGYNVLSLDLIDRGYGIGGVDFLKYNEHFNGDIITNPPYLGAQEFVEHALDLIDDGNKVAMFLKITFLEGKSRRKLFEDYPPKRVYVSTSRILCGKNGDFYKRDKNGNLIIDKDGNPMEDSSAVCYAWFIWEKGYKGDIILKHFN
jgi:hypothetical protein